MSDTPLTDAIDGFMPTNGAMIICCEGTGDYINREELRKMERKLAAAHDAIRGFVYDEVSDKESWARFKACLDGSKD